MSIDKINSSLQTTSTGKANNKPKPVADENTAPYITGESFDVTKTTKELKQALAATGSEPIIDTARIEAVRKQLDEGTYNIDAEKIAAKIIEFDSQT